MVWITLFMATLGLWAAGPTAGWAQDAGGVQRLYVFDCGQGRAADQSRWSPGVNVGKPIDLVDHCYLIRHRAGDLLWDTGLPDRVAGMPDGLVGAGGAMVWRRPKTLAAQLTEIGLQPADIRQVAISHTHGDHVGNVGLFPGATVLMQKAEHATAFAQAVPPFAREQPVTLLDGDRDVFGDGSVTILSTPGHTPGHQSLLVRLPRTGWIILSGDAVHFQENWEHRRVPSMNTDREQTLASLQRIADLMARHGAELWINHDRPQHDRTRLAPEYYE